MPTKFWVRALWAFIAFVITANVIWVPLAKIFLDRSYFGLLWLWDGDGVYVYRLLVPLDAVMAGAVAIATFRVVRSRQQRRAAR